jgi:hypothetical protein
MAEKGWTSQVAAAAGVAAGTGAAQLGLGYGLGVVEWSAVPSDDSVWLGSLGWATWIAASATVFGAVIASRLGRANGPWRFALAVSAAVGALLTVALIALPARSAVRTDTFSPQTIAGGYAVIGVLLGLIIAYWAVVSRAVAANLIATAAWLWALAVAAVVTTIFWHRPSATYLSSWQFFSPDTADNRYGTISWPSALLTLLAALIVGIIGVLPAVGRGDLGVGAASSGAVGPLLVAGAFFVLGPQLTGASGPLQSAFLIAPYAVLAGLAGSALMVAIGQRRAGRRESAVAVSTGPQRPDAEGGRKRSARNSESQSSGADSAGAVSARAGNPSAAASSGASAAPTGTSSGRNSGSETKKAAGKNAGDTQPAPAGPAAISATSGDDAEPHPRKSFMDRFRRRKTGADQPTAEQPVIVTGRAKAPSSATSEAPRPTDTTPAMSGTDPSDRAAAPGGRRADSARSDAGPGTAASSGAISAGSKQSGAAPASSGRSGAASAGGGQSGPASAGGGRSGGSASPAAVRAAGARPAASSPAGRSDGRSTVAPPPTSPPVAKINEPLSSGKPPAPRKAPARSSGNSAPSPADAANSDKSPTPRKTAAKSTKATVPAARTAPARPSSASANKPPATGRTPAKPAAAPRRADDSDTAELPIQPQKAVAGERAEVLKRHPADEVDTVELPLHDPKRRSGTDEG